MLAKGKGPLRSMTDRAHWREVWKRKGALTWIAQIVPTSNTKGEARWCTACGHEEYGRNGCAPNACERVHARALVTVPSLHLTEEDCAIMLSLIEDGQDIPWRLVVKLYEAAVSGIAGEDSMRDDRDHAENRVRLWEEAFERHAGEDLDAYTPHEACAILAGGPEVVVVTTTATTSPDIVVEHAAVSNDERRANAACARLRLAIATLDKDAQRRVLECVADAVRGLAPEAANHLEAGL